MNEKTYGRKTVRQKTYEEKIFRLLIIFMVIGAVLGTTGTMLFYEPKELTYGTVNEEIFMVDHEVKYQTKLEKDFVPLNVDMSQELQEFIYYLSAECNIDYAFVMGLIEIESNFQSDVVSKTNDYGLLQINEINHGWLKEQFGLTDMLDPYQNAKAGIYILRNLFEKYEDPSKVLMAYNFGEAGAKSLWNRGITQTDYSVKVLKNAEKFSAYIEKERNKMIKCKTGDCEKGKGNICCYECEEKSTCEVACNRDETNCEYKTVVDETGLQVFERKSLAVIQEIANIAKQKKELEECDKEMRSQLEKVMDEYGVKSFENDLIKLLYVEPTTRQSIDSVKLKKDLPEVYEKYTKVSNVKGSVRITVK